MIDIHTWMETFLEALDRTFPARVRFVGLQGSYGRGEATEGSDIDAVVILDRLSPADIGTYAAMLDGLPHRELSCGFLAGQDELLHWDPADLFQFYHDTEPVRGDLQAVAALLDHVAVCRAIRAGVCAIYHGCVHNMVHDKSDKILKGLYKSASFVIQAICYRQTGRYHRHQKDLLSTVGPKEQEILATFAALKSGGPVCFDQMSEALFTWAQGWITETEGTS